MPPTEFSAVEQTLGYLFQARRALLVILRAGADADLTVEGLDDLTLNDGDERVSLEQLKHHVSRAAALTDASPDLWKTMRIWSTLLVRGELPNSRVLTLVTTVAAPDDSAAALLRAGASRDPRAALGRLRAVAESSQNATLAPAFAAFRALTAPQQELLLDAMYVLDGAPDILATQDEIKQAIRYATRPAHLDAVYERLEGWWFGRVAAQLMGNAKSPIPQLSVHTKLADIAAQFHEDNLPIDFRTARPTHVDPTGDARRFVQQVWRVTDDARRVEYAIIDYYRAYEQRSRWLREELLLDGELEEYEDVLVEEWDRYRISISASHPWTEDDEDGCTRFGAELLRWVEQQARTPLRPRVAEPYVVRGSYHMLADRETPRVWWHPLFLQRLGALVVQ